MFSHSATSFVDSDSEFVSIKNAFGCKQKYIQQLLKKCRNSVQICDNRSVSFVLVLSALQGVLNWLSRISISLISFLNG